MSAGVVAPGPASRPAEAVTPAQAPAETVPPIGAVASEQLLAALTTRRRGAAPRGTARIEALCRALGSPHLRVPAVHVVGTNGKTSVARLVTSLLEALGVATGETTSPHLQDVRERIRLAGRPIEPAALARASADLPAALAAVERDVGQPATFFEAVTGVALLAFADAGVDVAVVEAGIGGVGDATNVVRSRVAVVTPVGLDHPELGRTLRQVAREKAGVVEPGGVLVSAAQPPEAAAAVAEVAAARGATLRRAGHDFGVLTRRPAASGQQVGLRGLDGSYVRASLPLRGPHQAANAAVALATVQALLGTTDLDPARLRAGLATARVPGRVELVRHPGGVPVVLDGAHDVAATRALVATLGERGTPAGTVVVFGVGRGRDPHPLADELRRLTSRFVVTRSAAPTAAPTGDVAAAVVAAGGATVVEEHPAAALDRAVALAGPRGLVVVAGSVHLAGDVRAALGEVPA